MAELSDVLVYVCKHYPSRDDLSKARLTKIVYLSDWKAALELGRQITSIQWEFNYYGPYVNDVIEAARSDPRLYVIQTVNYYGDPKEIIRVKDDVPDPDIPADERGVLDFIIEKTARKTWADFISLVYSTYPIITQMRFSDLDLVTLAEEYKQVKSSLPAALSVA